jgi:predicted transcriptional regulator
MILSCYTGPAVHRLKGGRVRSFRPKGEMLVSEAAEILGVSRRTMNRYISESSSLRDAVSAERLKNDTEQRKYSRRMQRKSRARRA